MDTCPWRMRWPCLRRGYDRIVYGDSTVCQLPPLTHLYALVAGSTHTRGPSQLVYVNSSWPVVGLGVHHASMRVPLLAYIFICRCTLCVVSCDPVVPPVGSLSLMHEERRRDECALTPPLSPRPPNVYSTRLTRIASAVPTLSPDIEL